MTVISWSGCYSSAFEAMLLNFMYIFWHLSWFNLKKNVYYIVRKFKQDTSHNISGIHKEGQRSLKILTAKIA